jgi:hypothetical protein
LGHWSSIIFGFFVKPPRSTSKLKPRKGRLIPLPGHHQNSICSHLQSLELCWGI